MADTPEEQEPGTDVETDCEETLVDGSLLIAGLPREILVQLAETLGNSARISEPSTRVSW